MYTPPAGSADKNEVKINSLTEPSSHKKNTLNMIKLATLYIFQHEFLPRYITNKCHINILIIHVIKKIEMQ